MKWWMIELMNRSKWINEWMDQLINESLIECMDEWRTGWVSGCVRECMNGWIYNGSGYKGLGARSGYPGFVAGSAF